MTNLVDEAAVAGLVHYECIAVIFVVFRGANRRMQEKEDGHECGHPEGTADCESHFGHPFWFEQLHLPCHCVLLENRMIEYRDGEFPATAWSVRLPVDSRRIFDLLTSARCT